MNQRMSDDRGDLLRAQQGDRDAFARLYDRHAPVVLSVCRVRLRDGAEDAMQETFIRAARRLGSVGDASRVRAWLCGIASNVCREQTRASMRRARHEGAVGEQIRIGGLSPMTPGVDATRSDELDRLSDALTRLDDDERLALHMYYLDRDPVKAGAAALGVSRSAYYKLIARAREKLATLMQGTTVS